jgi:NADP-dependent 3-hydroxy acid dehydrogenase YdfG
MKAQKVVVITGASSGIGMATAKLLGESGYAVVAHGRRSERLVELKNLIPDLLWIAGDLTEHGMCEHLFEAALSRFGSIDCVVNCAGKNHAGSIEEVDVYSLCEMVKINVESAFRVSYLALKHFKQCGVGHLVHVTSVMGYKVRESGGAYAGTKHAVEALCEALRLELARSAIRVSCIAPGLVQTELHRDLPVHPSITRSVQALDPVDVANVVQWLLDVPPHMNVPQMVLLPRDHAI